MADGETDRHTYTRTHGHRRSTDTDTADTPHSSSMSSWPSHSHCYLSAREPKRLRLPWLHFCCFFISLSQNIGCVKFRLIYFFYFCYFSECFLMVGIWWLGWCSLWCYGEVMVCDVECRDTIWCLCFPLVSNYVKGVYVLVCLHIFKEIDLFLRIYLFTSLFILI